MDDMIRYLDHFAEPTIREFEANPTSIRHAFLACLVTFHAIDYLAHPSSAAGRRQRARRKSGEFEVVDRVAHAFEHVVTQKGKPSELTAHEVIARSPALLDVGGWDLSLWDEAVGGVTLERERGIDLLETVKRAISFLRTNGPDI